MIVTVPGDLEIRADEMRSVLTGRVEQRRLRIGRLDLLVYMDEAPTRAQWQAFPGASVELHRADGRYALRLGTYLTDDEARSIVNVIEQVEARVKATLGEDNPV